MIHLLRLTLAAGIAALAILAATQPVPPATVWIPASVDAQRVG